MPTITRQTFDGQGNLLSQDTVQVGQEEVTRDEFRTQTDQAIDTLESAWTNWATLTAAQKDATLKLTVRVVTRLARLVLGRMT